LSTIRRELKEETSDPWDEETLNSLMAEEFEMPEVTVDDWMQILKI